MPEHNIASIRWERQQVATEIEAAGVRGEHQKVLDLRNYALRLWRELTLLEQALAQ